MLLLILVCGLFEWICARFLSFV